MHSVSRLVLLRLQQIANIIYERIIIIKVIIENWKLCDCKTSKPVDRVLLSRLINQYLGFHLGVSMYRVVYWTPQLHVETLQRNQQLRSFKRLHIYSKRLWHFIIGMDNADTILIYFKWDISKAFVLECQQLSCIQRILLVINKSVKSSCRFVSL